jgi:hypothetical protein
LVLLSENAASLMISRKNSLVARDSAFDGSRIVPVHGGSEVDPRQRDEHAHGGYD